MELTKILHHSTSAQVPKVIQILFQILFLKLLIFQCKITQKYTFCKIRLLMHIWKMNSLKMKAIINLKFHLQGKFESQIFKRRSIILRIRMCKMIFLTLKLLPHLIWILFPHFWKTLKPNFQKSQWHGKRTHQIIKWQNSYNNNKLLLPQSSKKLKPKNTSMKIAKIYLLYLTSAICWWEIFLNKKNEQKDEIHYKINQICSYQ